MKIPAAQLLHHVRGHDLPGPFGRPWRDTAIRGHITRGTGILNNELCVGQRIWNRLRYVKDPVSGRRRSRMNDRSLWVIDEVPGCASSTTSSGRP